jgi:D-methionine transport system ATP-binding protein
VKYGIGKKGGSSFSLMILVQNLYKSYGTAEQNMVLKDISIDVQKGHIFGIIGQSGVGKSTLLRCINGLEGFDRGRLIVNGRNVAKLSYDELRHFRKDIGMIFQNFALLNRKTVFENVVLPMQCWGYSKSRLNPIANELLSLVGLENKINAYPAELSGGQKQRVAIARALTLEPKILLCDEATSSLDPGMTQSILDLLRSINEKLGLTIVFVTHEMDVIKLICDNMAIIAEGSIKVSGSVESVFLQEPAALLELVGRRPIEIPHGKAVVRLSVKNENIAAPFLYEMAGEIDIPFTILSAAIEQANKKRFGNIFLAVPENDLEKVLTFFNDRMITCVHYNYPYNANYTY